MTCSRRARSQTMKLIKKVPYACLEVALLTKQILRRKRPDIALKSSTRMQLRILQSQKPGFTREIKKEASMPLTYLMYTGQNR